MVIQTRKAEGMLVVEVDRPRLDAAVADQFRQAMAELIAAGENRIVLDLGKVGFIDSAGLGAIVGVLKMIGRTGSLELAGVHGPVLKVFTLTRMTRVFTIRDTV